MSAVDNARQAAGAGKAPEGVALLTSAGEAGDAMSWIELAFWNLQGRLVPRSLERARDYFGKAADLGHSRARMIHLSLVANGTGGPSDFETAVQLLKQASGIPDADRQLELLESMNVDGNGDPFELPEPRKIIDTPEAWMFPGLFTAAECEYLVDAAGPAFHRAPVGHLATGRQTVDQVRTCDVAVFPWVAENPVVHALNRRVAKAADSPVEWGEPLQILRYRPGQEFKPHRDCTADRANQRVLTMLVYLNEDYTGGETLFLKTGQTVRGNTGDGLLFRNASPDGTPDPDSLHAGLPVASGEKLLASRWIRQKPFGPRA